MAENTITEAEAEAEVAVEASGDTEVQATEVAQPAEAPAPVSDKEKKEKKKKLAVVLTYVVALVCILAGLLVPLYDMGAAVITERMLLSHIPAELNYLVAPITKTELLPNLPSFFVSSGALPTAFDFEALVLVLYALTCVLALVMLIPVCVCKKEKNAYVRCAFSVEIIAMLLSGAYIIAHTYSLVYGNLSEWTDYNMFIVLGGTLIVACIQAIVTKGGMGVSRTLALVFSVLSALCILDLTIFIPQLSGALGKFSSAVGGGETANFIGGETSMNGLGLFGLFEIIHITDIITIFKGLSATGIVFEVLVILIVAMVVLNMVSDVIGIATGKLLDKNGMPRRHRAYNTYSLVRYILTFILVVALIVLSFVTEGISAGLYLYFLTVLTVVLFICAIVRTARDNAKVKKAKAAAPAAETKESVADLSIIDDQLTSSVGGEDVVVTEEPVIIYDNDINYVAETPVTEAQPYEQQTLFESTEEKPTETPVTEEPYTEPEQNVYTDLDFSAFDTTEPVTSNGEQLALDDPLLAAAAPAPSTVFVYGGDTDEFMETLTDAEKIEFVQTFLKKSKGEIRGIPEYRINGDNDDFFPAVFVYMARIRPMVSENLLSKMYKQLGKI